MANNLIGVYGKLPAHGDFVYRNLPNEFITIWDDWLQHYINGAQQQIGEQWLDYYLTSPIWNFVLSEGVIDEHAWLGIVLPSVDKVGRYFPFSIITQLPNKINPLEFLLSNFSWLNSVEALSLQALDGELSIDKLMLLIDDLECDYSSLYYKSDKLEEKKPIVINHGFEQDKAGTASFILDAVLQQSFSSYSAWYTNGSEKIPSVSFYSHGLPDINGISTMMTGLWQQWHWPQPYRLNQE